MLSRKGKFLELLMDVALTGVDAIGAFLQDLSRRQTGTLMQSKQFQHMVIPEKGVAWLPPGFWQFALAIDDKEPVEFVILPHVAHGLFSLLEPEVATTICGAYKLLESGPS